MFIYGMELQCAGILKPIWVSSSYSRSDTDCRI